MTLAAVTEAFVPLRRREGSNEKAARLRGLAVKSEIDRQWRLPLDESFLLLLLSHESLPVDLSPDERFGDLELS